MQEFILKIKLYFFKATGRTNESLYFIFVDTFFKTFALPDIPVATFVHAVHVKLDLKTYLPFFWQMNLYVQGDLANSNSKKSDHLKQR